MEASGYALQKVSWSVKFEPAAVDERNGRVKHALISLSMGMGIVRPREPTQNRLPEDRQNGLR